METNVMNECMPQFTFAAFNQVFIYVFIYLFIYLFVYLFISLLSHF